MTFFTFFMNIVCAQSIQMELNGTIQINHEGESLPGSGTIRWNGFDYEVWNGDKWISLTLGSAFSPYALSGGNDDNDYGNSIVADNLGNIIISGSFASDSLLFPNDTLLNTSTSESFIAKHKSSGEHVWSKKVGTPGSTSINTLSSDGSGSIYIGGSFTNSSMTIQHLSISGSNSPNLFIAKLDQNGKVLWLKGSQGNERSICVSMKEDNENNLYVLGRFQAGDLILENDTTEPAGAVDVFLAKYDTSGNLIWVNQLFGTGTEIPTAMDIDQDNNVYLYGYFNSDTLSFENERVSTNGLYDLFVINLSPEGQLHWMKSYGGPDNDFSRDIAVGPNQDIYLTGYYKSDSLDFDGHILLNSGNLDFLFTKLDQPGNAIWIRSGLCVDNDYANSVVINKSNEVYISGYYYDSVLSMEGKTLTNKGAADFFVAKYSTDGLLIEAVRVGENMEDRIQALTIDNLGNVFGVGYFSSSMLTFHQDVIINQGGVDFYFMKFY